MRINGGETEKTRINKAHVVLFPAPAAIRLAGDLIAPIFLGLKGFLAAGEERSAPLLTLLAEGLADASSEGGLGETN